MKPSSRTPLVLIAVALSFTLLAVPGGPALAQEWTLEEDQVVEQPCHPLERKGGATS